MLQSVLVRHRRHLGGISCLLISNAKYVVFCVSAECLNTVSEDNQDAQAKMQELGIQLQQFLNSQSNDVNELLLRVLISGKGFSSDVL